MSWQVPVNSTAKATHHTSKPYVRQAFRKYLECGRPNHGFARARCDDYGHDYFVAFSCKVRGVCPSCNTRRMVETAAHLTDHVFPRPAGTSVGAVCSEAATQLLWDRELEFWTAPKRVFVNDRSRCSEADQDHLPLFKPV